MVAQERGLAELRQFRPKISHASPSQGTIIGNIKTRNNLFAFRHFLFVERNHSAFFTCCEQGYMMEATPLSSEKLKWSTDVEVQCKCNFSWTILTVGSSVQIPSYRRYPTSGRTESRPFGSHSLSNSICRLSHPFLSSSFALSP